MQQRSVPKAGAAPSANKACAPPAAAAASKKKAPAAAAVSSKAAVPSSKSSSTCKGKGVKAVAPAASAGGDSAKVTAAPTAAAPPVPTDREGQARVVYNHYNKLFPVDSSGKMRWQDVDDEYCLSYGAPHSLPLGVRYTMYSRLTPPHSFWRDVCADAHACCCAT